MTQTPETLIKLLIGEQAFQIAVLTAELVKANARLAELEKPNVRDNP
jgi:hypothetical protein